MRFKLVVAILCCLLITPYLLWGQEGITVSGQVTDPQGEPLPGANVLIQLTNLGAAADINGDYRFNVPANVVRGQEVNLECRFIGYRTRVERVVLNPGQDVAVDFQLRVDALDMDAIIVTGVVEETPKAKMALSVTRLGSQQLEQVPAASPETALYGKVAGVKVVKGGGQPGRGASILLRAPTSIDARGRSQDPLFIVDGVIIDPSITGSPLTDIPGEEIESIEVVKGAAGASLYGARAANGVIRITTRRGDHLGLNQTRIHFRNEFGFNDLENAIELNKHHPFLVASDSYQGVQIVGGEPQPRQIEPGDFIKPGDDGIVGTSDDIWLDPRSSERAVEPYADPNEYPHAAGISFFDNDYKYVSTGNVGDPLILLEEAGGPFDHVERFFDPGSYITNTVSMSRNMEDTNFLVSFNHYQETGVLPGLDGFNRKSVRVNLDHEFKESLTLGVTGLFSQGERDMVETGVANPFFALTFMSADADVNMRDENGELFVQPDPTSVEDNPLNALINSDRENTRRRVMGSFSLRWAPVNWFNLEGNFSFDRSDRKNDRFWPIGYKSLTQGPEVLGRLEIVDASDEALNGNITAGFNRQFGDLVVRAKARALFERTEFRFDEADASDLQVSGTQTLGSAANLRNLDSGIEQVRSQGYALITGIDYKDRYIADFLVRRDGSSLFGPEERWHNYFRVAGAYRISHEPWWFIPAANEFKIRASFGTAGGRPNFVARFETFSVGQGRVSKQNLGNRFLKPEDARELEIGFDTVWFDRITFDFTYASTDVEDQILFVPLPSYLGFGRQWQNAGKLENRIIEGTLNASLIQKRDVSLTAGFNFDVPVRQKIARLDVPQYSLDPFLIKEGEDLGAIWGDKWIRSLDELPAGIDRSLFQINDDGFVVYVGEGNSFRDGIEKKLWGTGSDALVDDNGVAHTFNWGMPIKFLQPELNPDGSFKGYTPFVRLGSTKPDFNFGFNTNFRYKGFTAYVLLDAQIGGEIYNNTVQWGLRENKLGIADQAGKPDELKKPDKYYQTIYNVNATNSFFTEDGTYLKIRELRLSYSFDRRALSGLLGGILNKLTIGVSGRNLLTFTGYSGYDPEVGSGGFTLGSAAVARFDGFGYPNFRTVTGLLEFEF